MMAKSKLIRMDNVGIVVESLDETIAFFAELGLKLEGRAVIEGEWAPVFLTFYFLKIQCSPSKGLSCFFLIFWVPMWVKLSLWNVYS